MTKVKPLQCLADVALQQYGNLDSLFAIALLNGVSITDELVAGTALELPAGVVDRSVKAVLNQLMNIPASDDAVGIDFYPAANSILQTADPAKELRVAYLQVMVDIALQESGSEEDLFRLAALNGKSITQRLVAGELLQTGTIDNTADAKTVAKLLQLLPYKVASGDEAEADVVTLPPGGIGYMRIGSPFTETLNDFFVS